MPNWVMVDEADTTTSETATSGDLWAATQQIELLQEAAADALAALTRDDLGWEGLGDTLTDESVETRKKRIGYARLMAARNPLIKRGLGLRIGYVWGQGCPISIRDGEKDSQDVNEVVQTFLDDPSNRGTYTGAAARERLELTLGTDGELAVVCDTDPTTGRVHVRLIPTVQVTDRICDPEDAASVWFYRRDFTVTPLKPNGEKGAPESRTCWYPALGYMPPIGKRQLQIGGKPVMWQQPLRWVAVNSVGESWRGLGDAEAALPWAKLSSAFLDQWALLMKALSRFAWRTASRGDKAQRVATSIQRAVDTDAVGAAASLTAGDTLEAIPKSGATIDANSGRPLQTLVAAALGVPVTMLLGDPGSTGARAVAETLDQPTEHEMGRRRRLWTEIDRDILDHVIDSAVLALRGPLRGTVVQSGDRRVIALLDGDSRTIEHAWPDWDSVSVDVLMRAISLADQTDLMPPLVLLRLILQALGVDDADEVLATVTDDQGRFLPPANGTAQAQADADDRGEGR